MGVHHYGYCHVSTVDQDPQLQCDALKAAGCDTLFEDKASGPTKNRAQLLKCIEQLRERGITLASVTDEIDTGTTNGRLYFTILTALGEAERERIQERTLAGLAAARDRGRVGGRPSGITDKKLALAQQRLANREAASSAAKSIGISRATLDQRLDKTYS